MDAEVPADILPAQFECPSALVKGVKKSFLFSDRIAFQNGTHWAAPTFAVRFTWFGGTELSNIGGQPGESAPGLVCLSHAESLNTELQCPPRPWPRFAVICSATPAAAHTCSQVSFSWRRRRSS